MGRELRVLVTAALPYANARLHLGHLRSTYIPADIFARYMRLKGHEVVFICATDEHGTPIVLSAEREGKTPKEITDKYHRFAYDDLTRVGCSFDIFARTTLPIHYELTQDFFKRIRDQGHIYEQEVTLLYCENCKRFLPDRYVEGICPYCEHEKARGDECPVCGRFLRPTELISPYCVHCKSTPIKRKTKHWFFRLSGFESFLKKWIEGNRELPKLVKSFALSWIREGLRDWCISRDLDWGVPLPIEEAERKVLYVWFDAPIGYVSSTAVWASRIGKPDFWKEFWQKPEARIYHFIGKGIIYHHALFWPAMLKASGVYNLPHVIIAGGHYTLEGRKMSKSEGWVVEICDYLEKFDPDLLRYYLIATAPLDRDADFSWKDFAERCNSELADIIGNFIHRTLTFIYHNFQGKVPSIGELDDYDKEVLNKIENAWKEYTQSMDQFDLHRALRVLVRIAGEGNGYLSRREPWKEIETSRERAATTIFVASCIVKALAILTEPFLPFSAEKLWDYLNLEGSVHEQALEEALKPLPIGHEIRRPRPLFRKIKRDEVKEQEELLKRKLVA